MTILSYVGTLLLGVCIGYWLSKDNRKPKVIERHWLGFQAQERIHFDNINDYISKN